MNKIGSFDWDGTCVDTMRTKTQAFGTSLEQFLQGFPGGAVQASAGYSLFGGLPREEQLSKVLAHNGLAMLTETDYAQWSTLFTTTYNSTTPNLETGLLEALDNIKNIGYHIVISSNVEQASLKNTVSKYLAVGERIEHIFGSNATGGKGVRHSNSIAAIGKHTFHVGDHPEDVRAYHTIPVIGYIATLDADQRKTLLETRPHAIISRYQELLSVIEQL